jgi:hypothetical protein
MTGLTGHGSSHERLIRETAEESPASLAQRLRAAHLLELEDMLRSLNGEKPTRHHATSTDDFFVLPETKTPTIDDAVALCHQRLNELIQSEATWSMIAPWTRRLIQLRPDTDSGVLTAGAAATRGTAQEMEEALHWAATTGFDFWLKLHPRYRQNFVLALWREGRTELLNAILHHTSTRAVAEPLELIFVFLSLLQLPETDTAWDFYLRNDKRLRRAVESHGHLIGLETHRFMVRLATLAVSQGDGETAHKLVERIPRASTEYQEALEVLLQIAQGSLETAEDRYSRAIQSETSATRRVEQLGRYMEHLRRAGGTRDRARPFLNRLLANATEWLAPEPAAWGQFSGMVASHLDLLRELPALLTFHRNQALRWHEPVLDASLWSALAALDEESTSPILRYWRGVAMLHHLVSTGVRSNADLWRARGLVTSARHAATESGLSPEFAPHSWRELINAALEHIASLGDLAPDARERATRELSLAHADTDIDPTRVGDWLKHSAPAEKAIFDMLAVMESRHEHKAAVTLAAHIASRRGWSNSDLSSLWERAVCLDHSDLAWRAATVLESRQALLPTARYAWEASSERRATARLVAPDNTTLSACMEGLSASDRSFIERLFVAGPALAELLAQASQRGREWKPVFPKDHPLRRIESHLDLASFLPKDKRRWRMAGQDLQKDMLVRPPFFETMPQSTWVSVIASLSDRLGLHVWNWEASTLSRSLRDLLAYGASSAETLSHARGTQVLLERWLLGLSTPERNAVEQIAHSSDLSSQEGLYRPLVCVICRLSITLYPDHLGALNLLRATRAPLWLLRDLEHWIVSESWSTLRETNNLTDHTPVPNALRKVTTIHVDAA